MFSIVTYATGLPILKDVMSRYQDKIKYVM